jgi:hypothetical protein
MFRLKQGLDSLSLSPSFLWVVSTCVLICFVLLMDRFPSLVFTNRVFLLLIIKKSNMSWV